MTTLFIADLHLHESRPEITRAFYQFLQTQAQGTEALYILGDFFDAWIGDDDDASLPQQVAKALRELSQSGTEIFLMHGNRDFLLGENFAAKAGAKLIPEGTVITLYNCPSLLLHGDSLCTLDHAYQSFRQQVRSAAWQAQVLAQPLAARRVLAEKIRAESQSMNGLKAEDIMDVTPAEVERVITAANVTRLIHGHTHRPARHTLSINNQPAERIVLGDWHTQAWCVKADEKSLELCSWAIPH
jgi:UDP-2,3-diacylglucosamine hydrolase